MMLFTRANNKAFVTCIFFKWSSFGMILDEARISFSHTFLLLLSFGFFTPRCFFPVSPHCPLCWLTHIKESSVYLSLALLKLIASWASRIKIMHVAKIQTSRSFPRLTGSDALWWGLWIRILMFAQGVYTYLRFVNHCTWTTDK